MSIFGLDAAWGINNLTPQAIRAIGAQFVVGYVSPDPSKNLSIAQAQRLHAAGIQLVLVWESTAKRAYSGKAGGMADAAAATAQADALARAVGHSNWPLVYFAPFDADATPADQPAINDYFSGVHAYRGPGRAGAYGGYWPLIRLTQANVGIGYIWQTYAWSGSNRHPNMNLYQYSNSHMVGGVSTDFNVAMRADYGQLGAQPAPPKPTPPAPPKPAPPAHATGTFRFQARLPVGPKAGHGQWEIQGMPGTVTWGDVDETIILDGTYDHGTASGAVKVAGTTPR